MYAILESSTKKCFILMVLLKFTFLLRELKNRRRKNKIILKFLQDSPNCY